MDADSVPVIVGPTAIGKTAVAMALAELIPLEVVSADSRQVYRRLDIGTAKPGRRERSRVPHHGVDIAEPGERYSAGRFALESQQWLADIRGRGKLPVVVGGTGLYVRAIADGLFLEPPLEADRRQALETWTGRLTTADLVRWAGRLDPGFAGGGRQRATRAVEVALLSGYPLTWWQQVARAEAAIRPWYVVLTAPRPIIHQRIASRSSEMIRRGLIEEVAAVLAEGHLAGAPGLDGVGVREAVEYLHGQRDRDSVPEAITIATRQYAKRQQTWFRHQVTGTVWTLDATRPPEQLAAEIAAVWRQRDQVPPAADHLSARSESGT
ncbi:MAG: tRNA (adenosine(37)-N6)-dimethylallyltransferase MiaA [Gemmatimonadota bacterium]|nr:tRNA (adenosine(37)-N6)-dimethylallyltransferase MiaA [Gemmatimonadota bacterium]